MAASMVSSNCCWLWEIYIEKAFEIKCICTRLHKVVLMDHTAVAIAKQAIECALLMVFIYDTGVSARQAMFNFSNESHQSESIYVARSRH